LDVSFQHHNQSLRNRDAKLLPGGKLFKFLEKAMVLSGGKNCSRNNSYIQVGLENRSDICVGGNKSKLG
jgi:hypothetical protein